MKREDRPEWGLLVGVIADVLDNGHGTPEDEEDAADEALRAALNLRMNDGELVIIRLLMEPGEWRNGDKPLYALRPEATAETVAE